MKTVSLRLPVDNTIWLCRVVIAFVWAYHGIVPKLLGPHPDELAMALSVGISTETAIRLSYASGLAEIGMAICVMVFIRHAWPMLLTLYSMMGLLAFVLAFKPALALAAFNPVTTNLSVAALALICLQLQRGLLRQ